MVVQWIFDLTLPSYFSILGKFLAIRGIVNEYSSKKCD